MTYAVASSAGCPGRCIGTCFPKLTTESSGSVDGMSGVQMGPGRHRVRANSLLCKKLREACGEILNRALGRCVGEQSGIRKIGIDRRRIDDRTARLHVRNGRLGQIENGINVDPESQLPFIVADVLDLLDAPSAVVQNNGTALRPFR